MVVVKLKPLKEITNILKREWRIGVVGCEIGSGRCKNGGLREVKLLAEALALQGFNITLFSSLGVTCILKKVKKDLLKKLENNCDAVISLACGAGTQVLAENIDIPVLTGVDTLFIGAELKETYFKEYCTACGECIISETGGICPVARCPKSLLNGPCGGAIEGKCEVNPEIPCVWFQIEKRMEEIKELKILENYFEPAKHSKSVHPRTLNLEE